MTDTYLFFFGRTPELSFVELEAVIPPAHIVRLGQNIVQVAGVVDPSQLQEILGGTVKIARLLMQLDTFQVEEIVGLLAGIGTDKKLTFGISSYTPTVSITRALLEQVKTALGERGVQVRFLEARHGQVISSVLLDKQAATELVLVPDGAGHILVGQTVALQPYESWNRRDYGRPYADPKAGMLPPKVARMVVNIAVGAAAAGKTILDPFCGMGTILAEGLLRGCQVIGSDQSQLVVERARKNLDWLASAYRSISPKDYRVFTSDATHISSTMPASSVDAIVTEPYMGSTDLESQQTNVKNIIKGLEKLYVGSLKDWSTVLKTGSVVVMALPRYKVSGREYFVKKVVDSCENLGYTVTLGPIPYGRPQAVVTREFFVLQKK